MSYQEPFVKVIDTNATKQPNTAQFTVKNPLKKTIYVNSIQLSFDSYFSEKGIVIIKINGNHILTEKSAGSYARIHNFPVPLKNEELFNQSKIEVFVWNGIDTDFISCGVDIQLSENPEMQIQPDTPLSEVIRNSSISEPVILIPYQSLYNQSVTSLLDMKGYKNMIVTLASQNYSLIAPTIIQNDFGNEIIDGNISTFSQINTPVPEASVSKSFEVDFNSLSSKNLKLKNNYIWHDNGTLTRKIYIKNAIGDAYTLIHTVTALGAGTITDYDNIHTFRYCKVTLDWTPNGNPTQDWIELIIYEIYDGYITGGTGALSFEILDLLDNTWSEYISSATFGTITTGSKVVKQIGDINGQKLPSLQKEFRAKLTVTGGGLRTGVQITRV